jgi:hypothetical protein
MPRAGIFARGLPPPASVFCPPSSLPCAPRRPPPTRGQTLCGEKNWIPAPDKCVSGVTILRRNDKPVNHRQDGRMMIRPYGPLLPPGWAGPAGEIFAGMLILMKHTGIEKRL